jgi:hypothetical protein
MLFFFSSISTSSPSFRSISPRGFRTLFSYRALITPLMTSPISFCFPRINGYGLASSEIGVLHEDVSGNDADHGKLRKQVAAPAGALPRVRAGLGTRARGPGWPWGRIAGGAASQEGRAGKRADAF